MNLRIFYMILELTSIPLWLLGDSDGIPRYSKIVAMKQTEYLIPLDNFFKYFLYFILVSLLVYIFPTVPQI
jgi:hypothetical protein